MMGNKLMKTVQASALVAAASLGMIQSAHAGGNQILGAVIGAGAGTMIGREMAGREGAIIGAAVGAALGVGVTSGHHRSQPVYVQPAPVYQAPLVYQAPVVYPAPPIYHAPPVYHAPRPHNPPIIFMPGPVYRAPQTVVYAPPPVVVQPGWSNGHHGHHGGRDRGFQGGHGSDRGHGNPYRY
jgi:hypothetical protein